MAESSTRAASLARLLAVLMALALAAGAQYLFDHPVQSAAWLGSLPAFLPRDEAAAALLLVTGMVLFATSAPSLPTYQPTNLPTYQPTNLPTLLTFLALILYAANLALYLIGGESGLVRLLWIVSMALLVLAQVRLEEGRGLASDWQRRWRGYLLPAALLLAAFALRAFRLTTLPQDLHGDMASHGMQARAILAGQVDGIIGVGWADIPLPGFLPTAAAMLLSGDSGLLGLSLASAIGGVLSVWGLYVLANDLLGRRVALIATALLAVSYTHIHFSRIAEYMDPLPFAVWALVMLMQGLRSGRRLPFVLSGMFLAAAGTMYYAGRVAIFVVVLFLLYLLLTDPRQVRANRLGLLLLAAGFLVALGPQLVYFGQHAGQFLSRTRDVMLTNPEVVAHLERKYGVRGLLPVVQEQVQRILLMFNYTIDSSTQFGLPRPIVDSVTGPLVALGFAFGLRRWRHPGLGLMVIFLSCVLVLGGMVTNNAPFWPRLVMALLPAAVLAGVAADRVWAAALAAFGVEAGRILAIVVVGGLLFVGLQNWLLYYEGAAHNGRPRALAGRFIDSLPSDAPVCLVPEEPEGWLHSLDERETAFFLAPRQGHDVAVDRVEAGLSADDPCARSGAVWIVPETRRGALAQLQARFPGGVSGKHGPRAGEVIFYSYRVP